jgi:hypothetical protein
MVALSKYLEQDVHFWVYACRQDRRFYSYERTPLKVTLHLNGYKNTYNGFTEVLNVIYRCEMAYLLRGNITFRQPKTFLERQILLGARFEFQCEPVILFQHDRSFPYLVCIQVSGLPAANARKPTPSTTHL